MRDSPSVTIRVRRSVLGPIITDNDVASELGLSGKARHPLAMLWVANDPSVSDAAINTIMGMTLIIHIHKSNDVITAVSRAFSHVSVRSE